MMEDKVKILQEVAEGRMSFIEAAALLAVSGGAEVDIQAAKLDLDRAGRCGFPEFVYGEGKSREQLRRIVPEIVDRTGSVLVTRIDVETGRELCMLLPEGGYDPVARTFFVRDPERKLVGDVAIVTAGSSDLGVALEALYTLEACGVAGELVTDVGVAGLERLLARIGRLRSADLCIVVAGMEGGVAQCGGRAAAHPGDRGPDQCRLRGREGGVHRALRHVVELRLRRYGGEYRQWFRGGMRRGANPLPDAEFGRPRRGC